MPEPVKLSPEDAAALAEALVACDEHETLAAAIREFAAQLAEANPLNADVQDFLLAARRLKSAATECAIALHTACGTLSKRGDQ